jgi:hypothetical protein
MPIQGGLSVERMCELARVSRAGFYRSERSRAQPAGSRVSKHLRWRGVWRDTEEASHHLGNLRGIKKTIGCARPCSEYVPKECWLAHPYATDAKGAMPPPFRSKNRAIFTAP